jgi:signal transduction histidine kinase
MAFGLSRLFHRRLAAWWTLVTGLAITAALGWEMHREAVEMDRQRLAMRAAEVQSQLDARLEKTEMLLHNLRDYLMWSGENRNRVFARWCYENGLSINTPWLHGIAVATNRNKGQWQSQLPHPPETWTTNDWETFWQLTRRQVIDCDIALTSEVSDQKQFMADYSLIRLYSDNRDRLANTVQGSRLSMSDRRGVMWDANSNKIPGTLYYAPVYRPEMADFLATEGLTRNQSTFVRWMHLTALILAPLDFNELARSVWGGAPADLGMELFSSTDTLTAETWLNGSEGVPRAADPNFKAYLTHRRTWPMYGKKFSIFFYTTPLFEAQSPRRLAKVAMAAGTILTLLATALVGVALRARNLQEQMTDQIREARDALAAAQRERKKISRDLHDGSIQSLYAIQLGLGRTVEKLEAQPARAGSELLAVRRELDAVIAEIRQFITAEAEAVKPVDFNAVLHTLVHRARTGTTAGITLRCEPGAAERLAAAQAVQLANIAREALSNSLRHGGPQQVQLILRVERDKVILEISDDGAGFDPAASNRQGVGLASMLSRARELGGELEIQSSPGQGARILVRVPAQPPDSSEAETIDTPAAQS